MKGYWTYYSTNIAPPSPSDSTPPHSTRKTDQSTIIPFELKIRTFLPPLDRVLCSFPLYSYHLFYLLILGQIQGRRKLASDR